jgi:hypothetical protein
MRDRERWTAGSPQVRFVGRTSEDAGDRFLHLYPGPDGLTYVEQVEPGGNAYGTLFVPTPAVAALAQRDGHPNDLAAGFTTAEIDGEGAAGGPATFEVKAVEVPGVVGVVSGTPSQQWAVRVRVRVADWRAGLARFHDIIAARPALQTAPAKWRSDRGTTWLTRRGRSGELSVLDVRRAAPGRHSGSPGTPAASRGRRPAAGSTACNGRGTRSSTRMSPGRRPISASRSAGTR